MQSDRPAYSLFHDITFRKSEKTWAKMFRKLNLRKNVELKIYRRIEITAFQRRVTIVSGATHAENQSDADVRMNDAVLHETIETDTAEGRRILRAVRLLEERLAN